MGQGPLGAGVAAGVQGNGEDELRALLSSLPPDQREKLKAALEEMKTPRGKPEEKKDEEKLTEEKKEEKPAEENKEEEKPAEEKKEEKPSAKELTDDQVANVKKAFEAIDVDKSGSIEANELKTVMKALDVDVTDDEIQEVLKEHGPRW